jgi:hypothetical protein
LWTIAPEQTEELDLLFTSGVQARLSKGQSPSLGVFYNAIQIPEEALQQIWLLAHAAWQEFINFEKLKAGETLIAGDPLIQTAISAAQGIGSGGTPAWPTQIPAFNQVNEGDEAKAVREMYGMACGWAILHEVQHAKLHESTDRPDNSIDEERMCDAYALEFLFSKIENYSLLKNEPEERVRGKRAISALVGLYFVAKLSHQETQTDSHPSIKERIKMLFDQIGENPATYFWGFALALIIGLKPEIASIEAPTTLSNSRELAYFALEQAFS